MLSPHLVIVTAVSLPSCHDWRHLDTRARRDHWRLLPVVIPSSQAVAHTGSDASCALHRVENVQVITVIERLVALESWIFLQLVTLTLTDCDIAIIYHMSERTSKSSLLLIDWTHWNKSSFRDRFSYN